MDFRSQLAYRWQLLGRRLDVCLTDREWNCFFEDVAHRYSEAHRHYHTLEHIDHCMRELDEASGLAKDPDSLEFALFIHDVVYEMQHHKREERSNELKSAELGYALLKYARVGSSCPSHVKRLVLATQHNGLVHGNDARLMVDIDLAILGQPREVFDRYEDQIAAEYAWVPCELYRDRRRAILEHFLSRLYLYETPYFRVKYEKQARENLKYSIEKLKA